MQLFHLAILALSTRILLAILNVMHRSMNMLHLFLPVQIDISGSKARPISLTIFTEIDIPSPLGLMWSA